MTPPELNSDANSFSVTLRHNTIYNQQQLLWLQQFEAFGLDREQKAIVVLGIGGALVATQDIWDNLGIVDTEHYRQLVKSLQELGILTSQIPKTEAQRQARINRISVRKIPRFRISVPRTPEVAATSVRTRAADRRTRDVVDDIPDPSAQLWIGNLDFRVNEEMVVDFLSKYASVENIYMPKVAPGESKGYAFVEFSTKEVAMEVLAKVNGEFWKGRRILVRKALPRAY